MSMVPPTYAAGAHQAAEIMEAVVRAHRQLLQEENVWKIWDYAGSEPLRKLDITLAQAQWAFYEAKRRVRGSEGFI
jgi:hypothetical protein